MHELRNTILFFPLFSAVFCFFLVVAPCVCVSPMCNHYNLFFTILFFPCTFPPPPLLHTCTFFCFYCMFFVFLVFMLHFISLYFFCFSNYVWDETTDRRLDSLTEKSLLTKAVLWTALACCDTCLLNIKQQHSTSRPSL